MYINNRLFDGLSSSFIVNSLIGFWTQVGCHFRTQLWGGSIEWQQVWLFQQRWSYETLLVSVFLTELSLIYWLFYSVTAYSMLNLFLKYRKLLYYFEFIFEQWAPAYTSQTCCKKFFHLILYSYMYSKYSSDYNPLLPN